MDQQRCNGVANGKIEHCYNSADQVDRGLLYSQNSSPVRTSSPKKQSPVASRVTQFNNHNKSFSPPQPEASSRRSSNVNDSFLLNGSSDGDHLNNSSNSEKSFIQQRVERLYGPGALAQGFFRRSSSGKFSISPNKSLNGTNNNNNVSLHDDANSDESLKSLPVLRHLKPEFRAQLPVVSPRRPTDGSEQQVIVKPLKRISLNALRPIDTKERGDNDCEIVYEKIVTNDNNNMMTSSTTSLSDQQPAAPQVILPIIEPSASSTSINRLSIEVSNAKVEKDGHYFMNVLNRERERLLALADSADSELEKNLSVLPEEAAGLLRSGAGKARLLATQKLKQFEGLCQKNINQIPGEEFPTTNEDIAGFWDMVMLQVVQVNDLFDEIDKSRKSQWQEVVPAQLTNIPKRRQAPVAKAKPVVSSNSEAARKAREAREEARKQMIEDRRRAMRANSTKSKDSVEIFVPET